MSGYGIAAAPISGNLSFSTGNSRPGTYDDLFNIQESVVKVDPQLVNRLGIFAPTLRQAQDISDYPRGNCIGHCVWATYEAILHACCDAWNALMAKSEVIASIATRDRAKVKT